MIKVQVNGLYQDYEGKVDTFENTFEVADYTDIKPAVDAYIKSLDPHGFVENFTVTLV